MTDASLDDGPIDLSHVPDFSIGGLSVSPSSLQISAAEGSQTLQPRVMQVLVALHQREGQVVSRDTLIARCWDGLNVGDDAINRCVGQLRRIANHGGVRQFEIDTVARVGYRLAAAATISEVVPPQLDLMNVEWRHWFALGTAVFGIAALLVLIWAFFEPAAPLPNRVAVLPFQASDTRFADKIWDRTISLLTAAGSLTLARDDLPSDRYGLGHLDAALVIDGAIEGEGGEVKVRAHVDQARTGLRLWSGEFSRAASDMDALGQEVAAKVADVVRSASVCAPLTGGTASRCVQAAQFVRENEFPRARVLLEQIAADAPTFAPARVMLASAAVGEATLVRGAQRDALLTQARTQAKEALKLDPSMTDAHRVMAQTLPRAQWAEREALHRQATMAPGSTAFDATANGYWGRFLVSAGRVQEAFAPIQRSTTLDPLSAGKAVTAATALEIAGRISEAKRTLNDCLRVWPHDAAARLFQRRFAILYGSRAQALAVLNAPGGPLPLAPEAVDALRAYVDARTGDGDSSTAVEMVLAAVEGGVLDGRLAVPVLASLDDVDDAFAVAERTFADDAAETIVLFVPATKAMREDDRFETLAAQVGLLDYWRKTTKGPDFCRNADAYPVCAAITSTTSE